MVPIEFSYTAAEIAQLRRLNRTQPMPAWAWPLWIGAANLPSLLLSSLGPSRLMFLVFVLIEIAVLVRALQRYWKPPQIALDEAPRRRVYSESGRHELISHSEFEVSWTNFEGWSETGSAFVLSRLGRHFLDPKRAMTPQQVDTVRHWLATIGDQPPNSRPTATYQQGLQADDASQHFRFQYQSQDCRDALRGTAFSVTAGPGDAVAEPPSAWRWPLTLILLLGLLAVALALLDSLPAWPAAVWNFCLFLLPCGLIWLAVKGIKHRALRDLPALPERPTELVLLPRGLAVGEPGASSIYDWRDIDGFFQNRTTILVQCLGQQVFFPKRIFSGESGSRNFLMAASRLRRQANQNQIETGRAVVAIESGNPYQAPGSSDPADSP